MPMPHFAVIYVKSTDKAPKETSIKFIFPDGQTVLYNSNNIFLKDITKEYIIEKRLFPYIPFYIARYEKALAGKKDISYNVTCSAPHEIIRNSVGKLAFRMEFL